MERQVNEILHLLQAEGTEYNRQGMKRFGITVENACGVSMPFLRSLGKTIGKNHSLALALWESGCHEARILASIIDDPRELTLEQMDRWSAGFDSWDVCDQTCYNLFRRSPLAWSGVIERYAACEDEWIRRTAFALLAGLAVGDKKADHSRFLPYLALIEAHSTDPRNFVRKAVNWALRQIGKRSLSLLEPAAALALRLRESPDRTAHWIGQDAYRELTDPKIILRIKG